MNNLSERREFSARYRGLMNHLGMEAEKIQARQAHENGDVESLHRHFKEAVDQALRLRGSREFASVSLSISSSWKSCWISETRAGGGVCKRSRRGCVRCRVIVKRLLSGVGFG